MEKTKFDECIENRIHKIREILSAKAGEYATDYNRFHNFDVAARILDCTPEQALQGMMLKHIVSVLDLIQGAEEEDLIKATAIDEKIGDTINYLILLEGLLLRRLTLYVVQILLFSLYSSRKSAVGTPQLVNRLHIV
jgi:hypothetical protein